MTTFNEFCALNRCTASERQALTAALMLLRATKRVRRLVVSWLMQEDLL